MRKRIFGTVAATVLMLGAGLATATTASAHSGGACQFTNATPTLRMGTNNPAAVKQLQCELNHVMFTEYNPHLDVDGKFGQHTKDAVVLFQRLAQFDDNQVDGIVGPQTWGELDSIFTNGGGI